MRISALCRLIFVTAMQDGVGVPELVSTIPKIHDLLQRVFRDSIARAYAPKRPSCSLTPSCRHYV